MMAQIRLRGADMYEAVAVGSFAGVTTLPLDITISAPAFLAGADGCQGENRDLFFPDDYGLRHRAEIEEAKEICLRCPVRLHCLDWAVPQASLDGIWGATTPPERRRIRTGKTT
jgi:WhiB family transcriptional regulator, redox-sensing transcriptional regulator